MIEALRNSPFAIARHRILCDAAGIPEDYVFLDANPAFGVLTGLDISKIIGKRVTEVIPGIRESGFDWVAYYGKVACTGTESHTEQFSPHLQRWYKVQAYCDEPEHFITVFTDITETKKQAEELESFFSVNLDLLCIADTDGNFLKVNREWENVLGYTAKELESAKFLDFVHPDDLESTLAVMGELDSQKNVINFVNRYRTKDGGWKYIEWRSHPQGKLIYAAARDISGRIQTEQALQESLSVLEATIESTADGVLVVDRNERIVKMNQKFIELWQLDGHPALHSGDDKSLLETVALKQKNPLSFTQRVRKLYASPEENARDTLELADGRIIERISHPYRIDDSIAGRVWNFRDITMRQKTEESLKKSEERFRHLVQNSSDIIIITDRNGVIEYISDQVEAITGYTVEDSLKTSVFEGIDEEDVPRTQTALEQCRLAQGSRIDIEYRFSHKNGKKIYLHTIGVNFLHDPAINGLVLNIRDVTPAREAEEERKKAARQILEAQRAAEEANRAKSEFLANMSHEIRTPLNGVIGFTELLLKSSLSEMQMNYAVNANTAGKALLGIISDILDFSKIEAGKLELDIIETDIHRLMEDAIDIVKYQAAEKGLELLLDIPSGMPRKADCDPVRVKQILLNLLNNAVKFTEQGEVELSANFTPSGNGRGIFHFAVRDTGIGIREDQKSRLFQAFSQADSSTTRKFGGTGLGLTISTTLAQKMGGSISFESEVGKGSTFYVGFETACTREAAPAQLPGSGKTVLIIDDNESARRILRKMLESRGYSVSEVADGLSALNRLESETFSLAVVDYSMSPLDGLVTVTSLRKRTELPSARMPVILLHGAAESQELHDECKKKGIAHNLIKPVKAQELDDCLGRIHAQDKRMETTPSIDRDKPESADAARPVIVIAEDLPMNMTLTRALIERRIPEAEILEAVNGREAIELITEKHVDLVFMDVQMPEIDGHEAARRIRERDSETGAHIPIIALTAGALKEERDRAFASGMDDFLSKPIDEVKLKRILDTWIASNGSPGEENSGTGHRKEAFNRKTWGEYICHDTGLQKKLIDSCRSEIPVKLNELRSSLAAREYADIIRIAHSLKGMALNMCFEQFADVTGAIEEAARQKNHQGFDAMQKRLDTAWKELQPLLY